LSGDSWEPSHPAGSEDHGRCWASVHLQCRTVPGPHDNAASVPAPASEQRRVRGRRVAGDRAPTTWRPPDGEHGGARGETVSGRMPATGTGRRWLVVVALVATVLAVGAVLAVRHARPSAAAHPGGTSAGASPSAGSTPPVPVTFTAERAQQLERALGSGQASSLASVVAAVGAARVDPSAAAQMAALHLAIDPSSFQPADAQDATVTATASPAGAPSSRWLVELVVEDGQWKVAATQRLS